MAAGASLGSCRREPGEMKLDLPILYSIIIPAYNESEHIEASINSASSAILAINAPGEIVVVNNNSTDNTAEIAANMGCRVVFEPFRQIAKARNCGARAAMGRYLLFIDADTQVDVALIKEALELMQHGRVTGGGARIDFASETNLFTKVVLRFWQTVSRAARLAAGCFVFCTAEAFTTAGGFDERVFASEEIGFSRRMRMLAARQGQKFVIIDKPGVKTSARKNQQLGRMLLTMLIISIFPFAVRFRSLCFHWYKCR